MRCRVLATCLLILAGGSGLALGLLPSEQGPTTDARHANSPGGCTVPATSVTLSNGMRPAPEAPRSLMAEVGGGRSSETPFDDPVLTELGAQGRTTWPPDAEQGPGDPAAVSDRPFHGRYWNRIRPLRVSP